MLTLEAISVKFVHILNFLFLIVCPTNKELCLFIGCSKGFNVIAPPCDMFLVGIYIESWWSSMCIVSLGSIWTSLALGFLTFCCMEEEVTFLSSVISMLIFISDIISNIISPLSIFWTPWRYSKRWMISCNFFEETDNYLFIIGFFKIKNSKEK